MKDYDLLSPSFAFLAMPTLLITHGWSKYAIYRKNEIFLFADCKLQMNGEVKTSLQLADPEEDIPITVWGSNSCSIRILAIGGGGGE